MKYIDKYSSRSYSLKKLTLKVHLWIFLFLENIYSWVQYLRCSIWKDFDYNKTEGASGLHMYLARISF